VVVHVEAKGADLVFLVIIAVGTFVLPAVQRWLKQRQAGAAGSPREEDDVPYLDLTDDEPEAPGIPMRRWPERAAVRETETPAVPAPREEAPVEVKPLRPAAPPVQRRPGSSLEERVFGNRRWSAGAKLLLSREILERPKGFRRAR
jgi:hypothetical protein